MTTLADVRAALAETLSATGIESLPYPPRQVNPPAVFPGPRTGERSTQDGGDVVTVQVWAVVAPTNDGQHDIIDELIDGPRSIIDIIDANPTLGLDGVSAAISSTWTESEVEVAGIVYWGVMFTVEVRF